ncbi:M48 family metalloprotease [Singulisphaera sp. PoT]|uniref:M48 family metalloprotease n=1 Tax=Singulisphaera sp. PoT TaxID=3411797 RepID=UPI003BF5F850
MSYAYDDGSPGRGRGLNLRIIGALILAAFGIITYLFQSQVNPVTGKRQHVAMSVDQEKSLGLQAAPDMARQMGGAVDRDDPRARLVAATGARLIDASDASRSPYVGNYHFILLRDPETINAFALPGGQVFITLGLLNKLTNEAQLAGVLGHEIGHVVNRHSAQQMAKGRLGQLLTMAVGVGASDRDDGGRNAQIVAAMVNQVTQLRFSREDESEADRYGLRYMAQAGFNPSAMLEVMKILKEAAKGSHQPEILATHPLPETRLEEIKAILDRTYPNGIPGNLEFGRPIEQGQAGSR